jgi:hypothetical protein
MSKINGVSMVEIGKKIPSVKLVDTELKEVDLRKARKEKRR